MKGRLFSKILIGLLMLVVIASVIVTMLSQNSTIFFNKNKNVIENLSTSIISTTDGTFAIDGTDIVAKASELLGKSYQLGAKGASGIYSEGNYSLRSASDINTIDCAGLVYWTLSSLGMETSGFYFENPVPVDCDNWLQDSTGNYWKEACTVKKDSETGEWTKNSDGLGKSVYNYADTFTVTANGTTNKINVLKVNDFITSDLRYYEYYDTDGNKKELPVGTVIISYGKGLPNGDYNHAWIYIGDLGESDVKKAASKLNSLLGTNISEDYFHSYGSSTHWRIESAGGAGVTINNGDPEMGETYYEQLDNGSVALKGVGPVWAFQLANDAVEGTYHINVAKKSLNNDSAIDSNTDLVSGVTFELTQQIYGNDPINTGTTTTDGDGKDIVIFSGTGNDSSTGEITISKTGIGVDKQDVYTIKETNIPEKYEDINDLLQNITIHVYKKQDGKKLKIDYVRVNDANGNQIGNTSSSGQGSNIETGYDLDSDGKYDLGIVVNNEGTEFTIVVRNPEVTQEGQYKLSIAKKSRDKATTVEEGTASFKITQILNSNNSSEITETVNVNSVPVVSEDSAEKTAIEFNGNNEIEINSIGTDTYKIRESAVSGNYYIGESWTINLDVHKIEKEETVDNVTTKKYDIDYITVSNKTSVSYKYNVALDNGENRTTTTGEEIYNGSIRINSKGEIVTEETAEYVVEINVKDADSDGITEIDIVWTNPKKISYSLSLVKKAMKTTDYTVGDKDDAYILGDISSNNGTDKSWVNANTGDLIQGAVYGVSQYQGIGVGDIQNFANSYYNSANPAEGAYAYTEVTTSEELQTVFSNVSTTQTSAQHVYVIQELTAAEGYQLNKNVFFIVVNFEKQADSTLVINSVEVYCGLLNNDGTVTIQNISNEDVLTGTNYADGSDWNASTSANTKYRIDYSDNAIVFTAPDAPIEGNYDLGLVKKSSLSTSAIDKLEDAFNNSIPGATFSIKQYLNVPISVNEEYLNEITPNSEITVKTNSDGTITDNNNNSLEYIFENVAITDIDTYDVYVIQEVKSPEGYNKYKHDNYLIVRKTVTEDAEGLKKYVIGIDEEFEINLEYNAVDLYYYEIDNMFRLDHFKGNNGDESNFLGSIYHARIDYSEETNEIIYTNRNEEKTGTYKFIIKKLNAKTNQELNSEDVKFDLKVYKTRTEGTDGVVTYSDKIDLYDNSGNIINTTNLDTKDGTITIPNINISNSDVKNGKYYFILEETNVPEGFVKIDYQIVTEVSFYEFASELGMSLTTYIGLTNVTNGSNNSSVTGIEKTLEEIATEKGDKASEVSTKTSEITITVPNEPITGEYEILINKVDEKGDYLSGVEFTTIGTDDNNASLEANITTPVETDGTATAKQIVSKEITAENKGLVDTYTITESKVPNGYFKLKESITVTVEKGVNTEGTDYKVSKFTVNGQEDTDGDGVITIGNVELEGITETTVTIEATISDNTLTIKVENTPKSGLYDFTVTKTDISGQVIESEKTEFSVKVYSEIQEVEEGNKTKITLDDSKLVELKNSEGQTIDTSSIKATTGITETIKNIVIEKDSIGKTYYFVVEETQAPDEHTEIDYKVVVPISYSEDETGYKATHENTQAYAITKDGYKEELSNMSTNTNECVSTSQTDVTINVNVPNKAITGDYKILINKVDEKGAYLSGVEFTTEGKDSNNATLEGNITTPVETDGTETAKQIVSKEITAESKGLVDTYTITESKVPNGYFKLKESITVTVEKGVNTEGTDYKVSKFTVNGQEDTDGDGVITIENVELEGTTETTVTIEATISNNTLTIIVENTPKSGIFELKLVKYIKGTKTPLKGAEFSVIIKEGETEIYNAKKLTTNSEGKLIENSETQKTEATKDASLISLPISKGDLTYTITVEETKAPTGYIGINGEIQFIAKSTETETGYHLVPETKEVENAKLVEVKPGDILIEAENEPIGDSDIPHKGVKEVENQNSGYNANEKHDWVIQSKVPEHIELYTKYIITDVIDERLVFAGLDSVTVELLDESTSKEGTPLTKDEDYKVSYDKETRTLKIAFIEVLENEEDFFVGGQTSLVSGKTIEIRYNTTFALDNNGKIIALNESVPNQATLTYDNSSGEEVTKQTEIPEVHTGGIKIFKYETKDGEKLPLKDAIFKIATTKENAEKGIFIKAKDENGVDTQNDVIGTSDEKGLVEFVGLQFGEDAMDIESNKDETTGLYTYDFDEAATKYWIVEIKAPAGYIKYEEPVEVTINKDSYDTEISNMPSVPNTSKKGDYTVKLLKTDKKGNILTDETVTFKINGTETKTVKGEVSIATSKAITKDSQSDVYEIQEIKAPTGYGLYTGKIKLTVVGKETNSDFQVDEIKTKLTIDGENLAQNTESEDGYVTWSKEGNVITIKVENTYADLALRKFITQVDDVKITNRVPQVDLTNLKNETSTTAKYTHTKNPVEVAQNQIVTYTLRIYNEGTMDVYASLIKDDIPAGLQLLEYRNNDGSINDIYNWKLVDANDNIVTDTSKAKYIISDYLAKDEKGENLIKAFDPETMDELDYRDVQVQFKVLEQNRSNRIITNYAQISEITNENEKEVIDRDSTPNKWIENEDDQDIENLKLLYFDLALRKWVTHAIVIEDGKEKITETGHKAEDDPEGVVKVDLQEKQLDDVTVKFKYSIRITNEGDIAGEAQEISDYIPKGLKFVQEDNPEWTIADGKVTTDALKGVVLEPGESAEVTITLTWINDKNSMGVMVNTAEISKDYNKYNSLDIDSTPNNKKDGEDDIDDAPVMLAIRTGKENISYIFVASASFAIIAGGIVLIKKKVLV